jgi:uncharacterized repeat protein (TIGR03803 family)
MSRLPSSVLLACFITISIASTAASTEKVLYQFTFPTNLADRIPVGPLTLDAAGNLYGGAGSGDQFGNDSEIYQLAPQSDGTWQENVLYVFPQLEVNPSTAMVMDSAGNIYGASFSGGNNMVQCAMGYSGCGFIFEMVKTGNTWAAPKPIYSFGTGRNGAFPNSLTLGPDGNLYGTADYGGKSSGNCDQGACGSVYKLVKQSDGSWKFQLIHLFSGGSDGGNPNGGGALAFDAAGNVYGSSPLGGLGSGLAFEFVNQTTFWQEKTISNHFNSTVGSDPAQGMVFDKSGNLYGTTGGGTSGNGTVFELTPTTSGQWTKTVLYNFQGGSDGAEPVGQIVLDSAGNLYGSTYQGGASGNGTVWKLSPGSGGWTETILHSFAGTPSDGANPTGLIMDGAGNLYGVTPNGGSSGYGTVFEVIP